MSVLQARTFSAVRPRLPRTICPPQYETPFAVFDETVFTPNDAFFVRWQLADIPCDLDPATHRIVVSGAVRRPYSIALAELQRMPAVEIVAVNQCAGNGRALFSPPAEGTPWGNGAMGNARWTGVRLRDVLDRAGITPAARQVRCRGAERTIAPEPPFMKSLDLDVALEPDVIIAYLMNGEPLPLLNGYPVRLVVPGWYGTYWVKMLSAVTVLDHVDDNYWMAQKYRVPDTPGNEVAPGTAPVRTVPLGRMRVRSFVTNVTDGADVAAGPLELRGIAFDGGSGIRRVEFSQDGGTSWSRAALEAGHGRFAFRRWHARCSVGSGVHTLAVRATANDGSTQPSRPAWNPGGYAYHAIETYRINASAAPRLRFPGG